MELQSSQQLELLERRLAVMHRLAQSLQASQTATVSMNAPEIQRQAAEQQRLCREWRVVEDEIQTEARSNKSEAVAVPLVHHRAGLDDPAYQRFSQIQSELVQVQGQLAHLSRVHEALLRRMRRSIIVLGNVLASSATTYGPPSLVPDTMLEVRK